MPEILFKTNNKFILKEDIVLFCIECTFSLVSCGFMFVYLCKIKQPFL